MAIELVIALLLGVLSGTITGIIPGIHINLVSAVLLAFSASLLAYPAVSPVVLATFLVAMSITHTFVDYIPSIFLGAPDEDNTALSILPGHEMLIRGEAHSAVVYTLYGSASALLTILIFTPIFIFSLPVIYPYAQRIMPFILMLASAFLIYFEKNSRILAVIIFLLSGFLGVATLNLPLKENLLPLFTGLFGASSLITSLIKKQKIPGQKIPSLKSINRQLPKKSLLKAVFASMIASPLCSFLPGLGSGQAAVIGSEVAGDLNRKEFLILLGAINTIVTGLSFITLYSINKSRTGVAVVVGKILELDAGSLGILLGTMVLSGILAFFITFFLSKKFSKIVSKISYKKLSLAVIAVLIAICFAFSGWLGLLVLAVSTSVGLACIYAGVRRTHMMGCLIVPAILLYLI